MNLLAAIPSPAKNGFYIGPLFFHAYGIAYVVGRGRSVILICRWRWRKLGGDPELPYEIAMWAFPAGLIGGRIYFDVTTPSQIPDHWWGVLAIWDGGLGIWGGIAGGVLVGLYVARRRLTHQQLLQLMDVVGPALLVPQAIGRIGNYFNQELFGKPLEPAVGAEDLARAPPARLPALRHVRADLPLRVRLGPAGLRLPLLAR